MSNVFKNSNKF